MNVAFPYRFDMRGRTADSTDERHIRDLIEQLLFTAPGERVNRPDFGTGVHQLVFAPNSQELAAATHFLIQGALQRWLGELIHVEAVEVRSDDALLEVAIRYVIRRTEERRTETFTRRLP